jgi:GT2 family glycosyltransferase
VVAHDPQRRVLPAVATDESGTRGEVSVIVVCYNDRAYLEPCLSRLLAQSCSPLEVILVDNASADGSAKYARRRFAGKVRVIANGHNSGYIGAVDVGLRHATGDYVAVLNPDTEPDEHWLARLATFLDDHPRVGAVTSRVVLAGQRDRINALGLDIHIAGLGFNRGLGSSNSWDGSSAFPVAGVHGSSFLVRRHLLTQIAPIVQDHFLYHDDVQVSWLIHMMGYQIYCVPDSIVYHHYALHMFPEKLFWLERNRWEMLAYSLELRSLLLYLPLLALTELLTIGYSFVKGPRYVAAKLRAYIAVWRRRKGLRQKRAVVQTLRAMPDSQFVPGFKKGYAWQQLSTILRATRRAQSWVQGSAPDAMVRES